MVTQAHGHTGTHGHVVTRAHEAHGYAGGLVSKTYGTAHAAVHGVLGVLIAGPERALDRGQTEAKQVVLGLPESLRLG